MPRINRITKSRKALTCGKCRATIPVGSPYLKWTPFRSSPRIRCTQPDCAPRPSEVESNEERSSLMAAMETAEDTLPNASSLGDLESVRDDLASSVGEVAERLREKAQNIEDGFQHETEQSQEFQSRADEVESWQSDIEGVDFGEPDEDEVACPHCGEVFTGFVDTDGSDSEGLKDAAEAHRCEHGEEDGPQPLTEDEVAAVVEAGDEAFSAWLDTAREALADVMSNNPE